MKTTALKTITAILLLTPTLILTSCGNNPQPTPTSTTQETPTPEETQQPEETQPIEATDLAQALQKLPNITQARYTYLPAETPNTEHLEITLIINQPGEIDETTLKTIIATANNNAAQQDKTLNSLTIQTLPHPDIEPETVSAYESANKILPTGQWIKDREYSITIRNPQTLEL